MKRWPAHDRESTAGGGTPDARSRKPCVGSTLGMYPLSRVSTGLPSCMRRCHLQAAGQRRWRRAPHKAPGCLQRAVRRPHPVPACAVHSRSGGMGCRLQCTVCPLPVSTNMQRLNVWSMIKGRLYGICFLVRDDPCMRAMGKRCLTDDMHAGMDSSNYRCLGGLQWRCLSPAGRRQAASRTAAAAAAAAACGVSACRGAAGFA